MGTCREQFLFEAVVKNTSFFKAGPGSGGEQEAFSVRAERVLPRSGISVSRLPL
jgi:hypothetical protein